LRATNPLHFTSQFQNQQANRGTSNINQRDATLKRSHHRGYSKKVSSSLASPSETPPLAPRFKEGRCPCSYWLAPQRACLSRVLQKSCPENLLTSRQDSQKVPVRLHLGVLKYLVIWPVSPGEMRAEAWFATAKREAEGRIEVLGMTNETMLWRNREFILVNFSNGSMLSNLECY
jgi:hypothetical protein